MPLWTRDKRCETCAFWQEPDGGKAFGRCVASPPVPVWATLVGGRDTHYLDGTKCPTFQHEPHKPHPLDDAPARLLALAPGDKLRLREYGRGRIHGEGEVAEVIKVGELFVTVRAFNADYRIRMHETRAGRAGMVIGLPDWGIDLRTPTEHAAVNSQRPERAGQMLANVKVGDMLPLLGFYPYSGERRKAKVLHVGRDWVSIRIGKRMAKMTRTGEEAGLIPSELWVLDTSDAESTETAD